MNALEIKSLSKAFPGFHLDNINLTLPSGCIMGLVGENGAGKSTTIKLILDILHKDSGTIRIYGKDNQDRIDLTKEEIGVMMDEIGLPECLNTRQIGKIMQHTFRSWNNAQYDGYLQRFSLPTDKQFKEFSRGMKMKLGLAIALSHGSKLLLLDEATSGLDPLIRDEILDIFNDFTRDETHAILISSHIVSDLEKICDYIAFLHKGKLLLCKEKDTLFSDYCIVHCTQDQLHELDSNAVIYSKQTPYGIEALALRKTVPPTVTHSPISIEELFVYMVKEAN